MSVIIIFRGQRNPMKMSVFSKPNRTVRRIQNRKLSFCSLVVKKPTAVWGRCFTLFYSIMIGSTVKSTFLHALSLRMQFFSELLKKNKTTVNFVKPKPKRKPQFFFAKPNLSHFCKPHTPNNLQFFLLILRFK